MADKRLNIEIGERIIKVCVTGSKRSLVPLQSFMFGTPAGSVSDGQINNPQAIAEALTRELAQKGIKCRNVIFTLVSGKVAAREANLPLIREKRIKTLIESNAADYFPVDMGKYHISYTILDMESKGEAAGYRVLVLAAPLAILEGYFKLAEAAGLQIDAIDYIGNSQFRALENKCGAEVTMCINVDCNMTNVSIMKGKKLLLQRVLSIGADELIQNYMSAANLSDENYMDALSILSTSEQDAATSILPEQEIKDSLSRLISNIVRTAEYFNSSNWETPIEKFVLLGSCCHVMGLAQELNEAIVLPTVYIDALPGFKDVPNKVTDLVSKYLCCVGSAIRPVNFMPAQFMKGKSKTREKSDSMKPALLFSALCVLLALGMSGFSIMNYLSAKQDKATLENKITDLEYTEATYLAYVDYENGVASLNTLSAITDTPNDELNAFFAELEAKMPTDIRVLSAVCSTVGVDMNITVGTKEEAAMVIVKLRSFTSISSITVGPISESTDDTGISVVTFSVSCVYVDTSPDTAGDTTSAATDTTTQTVTDTTASVS